MKLEICLLDLETVIPSEAAIRSLPFGQGEMLRLLAIGNLSARRQSLGALLALEELLKSGGYAPDLILRGENGKPYFQGETPQFNLSHTERFSVAALATSPIGIDVELLRPERDFGGIVRRFFAEEERARWEAEPTAEQFYRLWTQKEARAKRCGAGLLKPTGGEAGVLRSFRLRRGDTVAYLSIAAYEPIERIDWHHHIKELYIDKRTN